MLIQASLVSPMAGTTTPLRYCITSITSMAAGLEVRVYGLDFRVWAVRCRV